MTEPSIAYGASKIINANRLGGSLYIRRHITRRFSSVAERRDEAVCLELERWWQAAKSDFAEKNTRGQVTAELSGALVDGNNHERNNSVTARSVRAVL